MRKILKYILPAILVILLLAASIYAYGRIDDKPDAVVSADTILMQDSSGRMVAIPRRPERVVILNPSNVELFYAAGGTAVGRARSPSYPEYLLTDIQAVPEVGMIHTPNLEKIISLKPDLVIGTNIPFNMALAGPLKAVGIPLFINSINSYDDVLRTLDLFGSWSGNAQIAASKKSQVQHRYSQALSHSQGRVAPRTLIVWGSPDSFSMATRYSFSGDLLNSLGGNNITDQDSSLKSAYVSLSMEYLAQKDPEVILIIAMGEDTEQIMSRLNKDMQTNHIWRRVSAVKHGRVHRLPAKLFTVNPGTQVAEAATIMSEYLYAQKGN